MAATVTNRRSRAAIITNAFVIALLVLLEGERGVIVGIGGLPSSLETCLSSLVVVVDTCPAPLQSAALHPLHSSPPPSPQ